MQPVKKLSQEADGVAGKVTTEPIGIDNVIISVRDTESLDAVQRATQRLHEEENRAVRAKDIADKRRAQVVTRLAEYRKAESEAEEAMAEAAVVAERVVRAKEKYEEAVTKAIQARNDADAAEAAVADAAAEEAALKGGGLAGAAHGTSVGKPMDSAWKVEYHAEGFDMLLKLRLSGTDGQCVTTSVISEKSSPVDLRLPSRFDRVIVPVIYEAFGKHRHYVGMMVDRISGVRPQYQVTYLDPENNPMPENLLKTLIENLPLGSVVSFKQKHVIEQKYGNTCGPKLIEGLAETITGYGEPEERAPYLHSYLLWSALRRQSTHTGALPMIAHNAPIIISDSGALVVSTSNAGMVSASRNSKLPDASVSSSKSGSMVTYLVGYISAFVNSPTIDIYLRRALYHKELKELESVLKYLNIDIRAEDVLTDAGFRKFALYTHPDLEVGKEATNKEIRIAAFIKARELQGKFNQDIDPKSIIDSQLQVLQLMLHKTIVALKAVDIALDGVRLYHLPTLSNVKSTAVSALHLYSMYSGFGAFSVAANAVSVSYAYHEEGFYSALQQASVAALYIALPVVLATASPYVAFAYSTAIAAYTGYKVISNACALYQSLNDATYKLESLTVHRNNAQWLHEFTGLELFKIKAQEYELAINVMQCDSNNLDLASADNSVPSYTYAVTQVLHNINISGQKLDCLVPVT